MNIPLISVIVPVYKAESYLVECLESIICQTYKNLEIILIDDGSPDNCGKICDKYAQKDNRITVIHKANGGPSSARNIGLDIAKGEYIAFVDSDDYIALNMYDELINIAEKENADIVICGLHLVRKDGIRLFEKSLEGLDNDEIRYRFLTNGYPCYMCNKIHKAHLFRDVRFPIDTAYGEDIVITVTLLSNADKTVFTPTPYYYYNRTNQNSLTLSFNDEAIAKYRPFLAWTEREKAAKPICQKAYKLSQTKTVRYAIKALTINMARPFLSQSEAQKCKDYLFLKRTVTFGGSDLAVKLNLKHKILLWSVFNCPVICKLFGKFTLFQHALKYNTRKQKGK